MSAKVAKILAFPKSKDSIKDHISYVEWLTRRFVGDEMTFMIFHQCHSTSHSARTSWFCKQWSIKHVRLILHYSTDSNLPKLKIQKIFISSFVTSKRRLSLKKLPIIKPSKTKQENGQTNIKNSHKYVIQKVAFSLQKTSRSSLKLNSVTEVGN